MSSTRESKKANVAVEQPPVEKAGKETKAKTPKEKKPRTASHPPYFQMIKEALLALNEKGGSSPHAIAKYMEEKHKAVLPENFRKMLALQLKNSASKGKLTKVKASYKLCESDKKEKAPVAAAGGKKLTKAATKAKQTKSKKSVALAARATATTVEPKKATRAPKRSASSVTAKKTKKMTLAKAKQPKSIKSPAAKRARKATA